MSDCKIHVNLPIIVEGKYDKIKLESLVDGLIITTDGFRIYKDEEKLSLIRAFAAAIGMVAVFCGVVNCPVASIILSVEMFGAQGLGLFGIACAVSYITSGYSSLYKSQDF